MLIAIPTGALAVRGLTLWWSSGEARPFLGRDGKPLPGSISEKIRVEINGVEQGMFNKGMEVHNPVLLLVHGGPGMPDYLPAKSGRVLTPTHRPFSPSVTVGSPSGSTCPGRIWIHRQYERRRGPVTYVFTQDVPMSAEVYGKIATKVGQEPMKGLIVHVASKTTDGKIHYFDVWESKELCDRAFEERIGPATRRVISDSGTTPITEPERQVLDTVEVRRS